MNWFYSKDGQQLGPVAFAEIQRLLAEGQITEESLVWQQGTPNWVKLSTVLAAPAAQAPNDPATPPIPAAAAPSPVVVVEGKVSGLAITSLVLSILGLFCCTPFLIFNLAAVIFGHLALGQINKDLTRRGRGLAIAGLIIGYIGIAIGITYDVLYGPALIVAIQDAIVQAQQMPTQP